MFLAGIEFKILTFSCPGEDLRRQRNLNITILFMTEQQALKGFSKL